MAGIPMEVVPASETMDLETIRSRIGEIAEICRTYKYNDSQIDSDQMVYEFASDIQRNVDQMVAECSELEALGDEDLDACMAHLQTEVRKVEEEKTKLSDEVGALTESFSEDLICLETELEKLTYSVDHIASKALECREVGHSCPFEDSSLRDSPYDTQFEMMELSDQIEKNNKILLSLQDLDVLFKRFEAVESIEDALTGVKVLGYENSFIRFAVRTYIPSIGGSFSKPTTDDVSESSVVDHELLVTFVDGTLEPENLEVIPNDIHFAEILDAAKAVSHTKTLGWLVRKVQDIIVICTLRRNTVKAANSSRHSFEYNDAEETIVCRMVGEVDAYIKIPLGWPIINSTLKLISVRIPDKKRISLAFLCKVQESANSLDSLVRQNLQSFAEAIEEILMQQMHKELNH